ncbi:class I SAM-dependent methyltransferase [Sphingomonas swuensis]|uniref:Class I SAM-dependent methyltransferase n=1 Tax=Sphingomonas swuensis TaxID=977800 RepID=A0ABP7ST07_9SPHN
MGFPDHFSGHAALYAASRPTYPEHLIAELAALVPGHEQAWDVGTGNGQAAQHLARHFEHVFASDASAAQIAEATPVPGVTFAVEPAERCSLPDHSVDLILAAQCFHWFDHPAFFAEARRVLRPGGLFAAIGYGWWYVDDAVDTILATLLKRLEPHWAPGNWLLIDGYRAIDVPGAEVRVPPAAIHLRWERAQVEAYVLSWSVVQRLGTEVTDDCFEQLRVAWPDGQKRQVTMPIAVRASRL